jgi:hypothetical protein
VTTTTDQHTEKPRYRRRPMAAGHAVLVMLVAFAIATLFNADTMMHTAENLPLGSTKRSVAVGVMRPIRWVSDTLQITRPRKVLDAALGKETKTVKDPFTSFTSPTVSGGAPATTVAPGQTATSAPGTTQPGSPTTKPSTTPSTVVKRFHPTSKRPLKIMVAGDSLSFEYGLAMGRLASSDPELEMEGAVDYHVASGIARPDFFNWPAELDAQMKARDPDVVVFMVGSNDDQSLAAPDGHTYRPYTDGWKYEYARRAAAVMDQVNATKRVIVWVGIPVIQNAARSAGYQTINTIVKQQTENRPDAFFLNPYKLFSDKDGNYQQFLPNESGTLVKMRANDGIHFERAGGDRLAAATLRLLDRHFPPRSTDR